MELYVEGEGWLHRLDPRTKLVTTVVGTMLLLTTSNILVVVSFLAAVHAALLSSHVPWSRIRWAWQVMLPVTILVPVLWPLFSPEGTQVIAQLGPVSITLDAVVRGLAMAFRIDALGFVWFLMLFSTDQSRLILGMVRLGLPFDWGLAVAIALRYLPVLQGAYNAVSEAQQARGLVLGRGNVLQRARAQLPILVAMMIGALRTASQLALALQARAYRPGAARSSYRELRMAPLDCLALAAAVAIAVVYLYARFALGFAAGPV